MWQYSWGPAKASVGAFRRKAPERHCAAALAGEELFFVGQSEKAGVGRGGVCEAGQTSRQRLVLLWACEVSRADVVAMEREKLRPQREADGQEEAIPRI